MKDKRMVILTVLAACGLFFRTGWELHKYNDKKKDYQAISYYSIEYRPRDSSWTLVPKCVITGRSKEDAIIMADSIMIAQTLKIDSAAHAGGHVRIGGDGVRTGTHIETINIYR